MYTFTIAIATSYYKTYSVSVSKNIHIPNFDMDIIMLYVSGTKKPFLSNVYEIKIKILLFSHIGLFFLLTPTLFPFLSPLLRFC